MNSLQQLVRRRDICRRGTLRIGVAMVLLASCPPSIVVAETTDQQTPAGIQIHPPDAAVQPTFWQDIRPILERSCLACHNENSIESDVILETVETMLAYESDEPLIVPGDPMQGKLLKIASHQQEPIMPPEENEAGAANLTPAELGLIQRWIELGAPAGEKQPPGSSAPTWQPLPKGQSPVMAARLTPRGDLVARAAGNHLELFDLHDESPVIALVDPSLVDVGDGFVDAAHLDMIRALAIRRDGQWIASGGFRTVKLWRQQHLSRPLAGSVAGRAQAMATGDGWLVVGDDLGNLAIATTEEGADAPPRQWKAHETAVVAATLSENQESLVSAAIDGTIRRWNVADGKPLAAWKTNMPIRRAVFPNDQRLVAAADDLVLRSYQLPLPAENESAESSEAKASEPQDLAPSQTLRGHGRQITALGRVANAPGLVISGGDDGFVRLWDLETGQQKQQWIHGDTIRTVLATSDGTRLFSVGGDATAKAWSVETEEPLWQTTVDFRQAEELHWARQSAELAAANLVVAQQKLADAQKQLETDQGKATAGKEKLAEAEQQLAKATAQLEAAEKKKAAAAEAAAAVAKLQQQAGELLEQLKTELAESAQAGQRVDELLALATQLRVAEPAEDVAEDASAEKPPLEVAVDELSSTLATLRTNREQQLDQLTAKIDALMQAVSEGATHAAAESEALEKQHQEQKKALTEAEKAKQDADDLVRRAVEGVEASTAVVAKATRHAEEEEQISTARGAVVETLQQQEAQRPPIVAAGSTADGLVWFADQGGAVHVLDVDGRPRGRFKATEQQQLAAACATAAGQVVVAAADPHTPWQAWQLRGEWNLAQTIGNSLDPNSRLSGRVLALDFSSDGKRLAIGSGVAASGGQVVLWDLDEQQIERELEQPHGDVVLGLEFSRDGTRLATSSADRLMRVFAVDDGRLLRTFEGHSHHVLDVAWRANGLQLATGSADKTAKLWDYATGEQVRTLPVAKQEIVGVEFLGTGNLLAVAAGDGIARIYNVDDGKQARAITSGAMYLFTAAADAAGDKLLVGGVDQFWQVYSSSDGAKLHDGVDK